MAFVPSETAPGGEGLLHIVGPPPQPEECGRRRRRADPAEPEQGGQAPGRRHPRGHEVRHLFECNFCVTLSNLTATCTETNFLSVSVATKIGVSLINAESFYSNNLGNWLNVRGNPTSQGHPGHLPGRRRQLGRGPHLQGDGPVGLLGSEVQRKPVS